jgi:5-formyltetrahydrofolate cyclo-ligase
MAVEDEKQELRRTAKENRAAAQAAGADSAARLADNFQSALPGFGEAGASGIIAGYWPMADEIDIRPLLAALHDQGRTIVLPVVAGSGEPLIFRRWLPEMALQEGTFGTLHPGADAQEETPGLLLVPLLAFDGRGARLGWGGGFYDRTLAHLRAAGPVIAVGAAYHGQRMERVPQMPGDQPLDWIVTDEDVIEAG